MGDADGSAGQVECGGDRRDHGFVGRAIDWRYCDSDHDAAIANSIDPVLRGSRYHAYVDARGHVLGGRRPAPEDRRSDADDRRAFFDRDLEIVTHAHGKMREIPGGDAGRYE